MGLNVCKRRAAWSEMCIVCVLDIVMMCRFECRLKFIVACLMPVFA